MKTFYDFLKRVSTIKALLIWFLFYLAYFIAFMLPLKNTVENNSESRLLDLMVLFSEVDLYRAIEDYGTLGRDAYLNLWYLDFIYPVINLVLFYLLIGIAFKRINLPLKPATIWLFFPVLATLADFGENISFLSLVHIYPNKVEDVFMAAFVFNVLKWLTISALSVRIIAAFFKKKTV